MINTSGLSVKFRILFTAVVTLLVWIHLGWDHFHSGVPTHYLLQSEDLPGISNWWGGFTLPMITFLLLFWIHKNLLKTPAEESKKIRNLLVSRFIRSLIFGIILSFFFTIGSPAPGYMMLLAILLSFFVPLYRPEYLLGFILGMSYTFGANLPILVSLVLFLIFLFAYKVVRYGIVSAYSKLKKSS